MHEKATFGLQKEVHKCLELMGEIKGLAMLKYWSIEDSTQAS